LFGHGLRAARRLRYGISVVVIQRTTMVVELRWPLRLGKIIGNTCASEPGSSTMNGQPICPSTVRYGCGTAGVSISSRCVASVRVDKHKVDMIYLRDETRRDETRRDATAHPQKTTHPHQPHMTLFHTKIPAPHPWSSCRHYRARVSHWDHSNLQKIVNVPKLKMLAALQRQLCLGLALRALQPQDDLFGRLGLLVEDRLRLTTVSGLLAIVTTLALREKGGLEEDRRDLAVVQFKGDNFLAGRPAPSDQPPSRSEEPTLTLPALYWVTLC